jgi:hypothetical protein
VKWKKIHRAILENLYIFRCLTESQILELVEEPYRKNMKNVVPPMMLREGLVEEYNSYDKDEKVYYLSTKGVNKCRYLRLLPTEFMDINKEKTQRGYLRASELKIHPNFLNHQIALNSFVIRLMKKIKSENPQLSWKFQNEKNATNYTNIRPDGIFSVGDIDFFLEMDMGTESEKQLQQKWENYRLFLSSNEYMYSERDIIVLFIVHNIEKQKERIILIKKSIYESIIDMFDPKFDIVVGDDDQNVDTVLSFFSGPQGASNVIKNEDLIRNTFSKNHNFEVYNGENAITHENFRHLLYIRRYTGENKNRYKGKELYFVDDYSNGSIYSIYKAIYIVRQNIFLKEQKKREIPLIIIAKNEAQVKTEMLILKLTGIEVPKTVYFTTINRLSQNKHLNDALFQVDIFGGIYSFSDATLKSKKYS